MYDVATLVAQHLDLDNERGWVTNFSMKMPGRRRREALASPLEARNPSRASSSFQAMRMPLPPPPADALIITG